MALGLIVAPVSTNTRVARAATNETINFQARILQASGALVPDGNYNVEFKIYDSPSTGATSQGVCSLNSSTDDCWWVETRTGVNAVRVVNGYVSVNLGSVTPFGASIPWDQELYITMRVGGVGAPTWDTEMVNPSTGRMKMNASTFAKLAAGLRTTNGANSTAVNFVAPTGTNAISFDDASGLVCLDSGNCDNTGGGYLLFGSDAMQNGSTAGALLRANQQGAGGLLDLQSGGSSVFTIANDGLTTLTNGVTLGNTSVTVPGTLRWTGTDFEGYDGAGWVSLTSGGGGGGGSIGRTVVKTANEDQNSAINAGAALQNDDQLFFAIGANETWAFRYVVQAISPAAADLKFAVTAPSGAVCTVGVTNAEDTVTVGNLGCGISSGILNTVGGAVDVYEIVGTVVNGATAGNVTLQWAQNTANATSSTVYAGSSLFATANGTASTTFEQGGNAFGGTAVLGTTDVNGLNIITNGATRISVNTTGQTTFNSDVTLSSGNLNIASGVIDINSGGITNAGSITGIGSNLTATNGLTIASGGVGSLSLDSASGTLVLLDDTIQRQSTGLTFDILNASQDTDFMITNSGVGQEANLVVEGAVTATSFIGSGSSLTSLDGSAITSGTISDTRLTNNVALLDTDQTFTGRPTFSTGLTLGNSTSTAAGTLRWTGTDFEGYDGIQWQSLTSGGGGGGGGGTSPALTTVNKATNEVQNSSVNPTATLQNDEHLFFAVGANETWNFRFVLQANSPVAAGMKFAVTGPAGSTCSVGVIDAEGAVSAGNLGCGVSSGAIVGTGANDIYEVVGSITTGGTAGTVRLQWAQDTANASNSTIYTGSYLNAMIGGGGLQFLQGGNDFGATAIIGTTQSNDFNIITNNTTRLSLTSGGQAIFSAEALLNGGLTIGNSAGDGFTIVSDSVGLTNGLNFDSNTFVIDSVNNRVGIGTATPDNPLSINDAPIADSLAQVSVYTNGASNKGLIIQGATAQSANLFEVQNDSGTALAGFNASGQLVLGVQASTNGRVVFNNNINANTITIVAGVATATRTIELPDESGTICLSNSNNCGYIRIASASLQTDSTTNDTIGVNKTGASGNLIRLQKNGADAFVVGNSGALQIRTTSTTGLDIQTSGGVSTFSVDTSGNIVRVGQSTADGTGVLFVLDTKNTTGDPSGINGGQYYNSADGKFRCFEAGAWVDCLGNYIRSFVDSTADAVVDANTTNYWDTAAENNNVFPNITLSQGSSKSVMGMVTIEVTSTSNADTEVTARVERGIGSVPTCGTGVQVGGNPGVFTTNTGAVKSSTITFLDSPNTTSQVFYVLCSDSTTAGTGANISRIRVTLQEVINSN